VKSQACPNAQGCSRARLGSSSAHGVGDLRRFLQPCPKRALGVVALLPTQLISGSLAEFVYRSLTECSLVTWFQFAMEDPTFLAEETTSSPNNVELQIYKLRQFSHSVYFYTMS